MRTMLLPGLLGCRRPQYLDAGGAGPSLRGGQDLHPGGDVLPSRGAEGRHASAGRLGPRHGWTRVELPTDFYLAKGILERLLPSLGLEAASRRPRSRSCIPGRVRRLSRRGNLGLGGGSTSAGAAGLRSARRAVAAEIDLDQVLALGRALPLFEDLLTYPAVEQDLALWWSTLHAGRRRGAGRTRRRRTASCARPDLRRLRGPQVGEGKKSLALQAHFPFARAHPERSGGQRVTGGHAGGAEDRYWRGVERLIGSSPERSLLGGVGEPDGFSDPIRMRAV